MSIVKQAERAVVGNPGLEKILLFSGALSRLMNLDVFSSMGKKQRRFWLSMHYGPLFSTVFIKSFMSCFLDHR